MQFRDTRSALVATAISAAIGLAALGLVGCGPASDGGVVSPSDPSSTKPPTAEKATKNQLPAGPLQVLTVEVLEPVVDLGRVPLNTPVRGEWLLLNTGATPVSVGRLSIEVLEGC